MKEGESKMSYAEIERLKKKIKELERTIAALKEECESKICPICGVPCV